MVLDTQRISEFEEEEATAVSFPLEFEYGSKKLSLYRDSNGIFYDYIKNEKEAEFRIPGETAQLYKLMKKAMQRIVNQEKKPSSFVLRSKVDTILGWANTTGNEIFSWDKGPYYDEKEGLTCYSVTFKPEDRSDF